MGELFCCLILPTSTTTFARSLSSSTIFASSASICVRSGSSGFGSPEEPDIRTFVSAGAGGSKRTRGSPQRRGGDAEVAEERIRKDSALGSQRFLCVSALKRFFG